ncbi:D-cysteine desulfhydrase family protein [Parvibaculum sp.]|uniref:D-cysteine desulfhydrase family protein n=2 Tax=Parvibaculum sp. TaxID=2024848 RepID=UPI001B27F958|nr:D-cysteine desulfhydrase family protein [Parvibaculum sp.]MBO6678664.1 D-cysteine desulfhydrase family protein [Parvibaculum sp.]MBO6684248.1 D-cysteine desulfhydrase family protein [Parvibaculum sp.]MBO6903608.1 D-cysteine desulfhydrase family protein [Parvibaculum sp.]
MAVSLDDFPRFPLAHLPTPLAEMRRLRDALASEMKTTPPRLFIKRDDCTGLAGGGNKTRKLEYLIGEALASGCDTVVTTGAVQSNHARQTAAAAAAAGLRCVLVLFDTVPYKGRNYRSSGNLLLDRVLGAEVRIEPADSDAVEVFGKVMGEIEAGGGKPYFVPVGGSSATGSLGYARAYLEVADQLEDAGLANAVLLHASSSGGTQAGLVAGAQLRGSDPDIVGINVYRADNDEMAKSIHTLACKTADLLGVSAPALDAVVLDGGHLGDRYGMPTEPMRKAVELVAQTEGVLLDPVYTGKGMAGFIAQVIAGLYADKQCVIFLHTGGMPGLFAYEEEFPVKKESQSRTAT